ncbi:MAG: hypothetical protein OSJ58_16880, partial [Dysosmobacter sp.]|nr:hypothetical protein [Dysosmobacter sp.]
FPFTVCVDGSPFSSLPPKRLAGQLPMMGNCPAKIDLTANAAQILLDFKRQGYGTAYDGLGHGFFISEIHLIF